MAHPFISLLSDFGSRDPSAGIVRGIILDVCPEANVVDISHEVAKFRVRDGALLLWCALPFLPVGTHVGIVDPGVGTARRGVGLRVARGDVLIGPDNGLLLPAAERLGGVTTAHELTSARYLRQPISPSFHGRDVFAPAAAHLANGVALQALGSPIAPADLVRLAWPEPEVRPGELRARVLYVDTFGNLKLGALTADLLAALGPLPPGSRLHLAWRPGGEARSRRASGATAPWVETFGRVALGEPLVYEDSYGRLCLAVNQGSAAQRFGLGEDVAVSVRRA